MSLVSVKNLVAPLTNSTHLVTIVLVTILFALFRLQGGSVQVSRDNDNHRSSQRSSTPAREQDTTNSDLEDLQADIKAFDKSSSKPSTVNNIPDKGTITITREDQDLLGEMIGSKPLPPKREVGNKPPKQQAGEQRTGDSLEDIERSLGLR